MNKYNKKQCVGYSRCTKKRKRCPLPPKPCTRRFWKAENIGPVDMPIEWWKGGSGSLERDNVSAARKRKSEGKMCAENDGWVGVGNGSLEVATSALRHKQEKGRHRMKAYELEWITL